MSDSAPDSTSGPTAAEQVVEGIGASPGIAIGTVYRYTGTAPAVERTQVPPEEVEEELTLFDDALTRAQEELETIRSVAQDRLGASGNAIFEAQALMLDDDELLRAVRTRIQDDHASAAHALSTELQKHRQRLEESDDPYLRDRVDDFDELEGRLLRALQRGSVTATIAPNSIVVADRLTAADVFRFGRNGVLGIVAEQGGPTSHVSILARALHLPAIVGAEGATDAVSDQDRAIVDGRQGRFIVRPSDDTLARYRGRRVPPSASSEWDDLADSFPETTDGRRITLRANIDFIETLGTLETYGAEGIGLMRTEMLFLKGRDDFLTEENQASVYRRAVTAAGEHGATIRLLDLGGDKLLSVAEAEDNPFLGWRGLRVLLDRPDELLRPQLRALLRANAHGTVRVLLPMVTELNEVRRVRTIIDEEAERLAAAGTEHDADLRLGAMVEVPAVALQAEAFAKVTDFLSIGTNDLTQYVLAVDRGNERVVDRFDALHPAVLRLVRRTVEAGTAHGTPVSLCGEVAGDAYAVPILIGLGLDSLSVAPSFLPVVKRIVCNVKWAATQELADAACAAPDAAAVRQRARDWIKQHLDQAEFADVGGLVPEI